MKVTHYWRVWHAGRLLEGPEQDDPMTAAVAAKGYYQGLHDLIIALGQKDIGVPHPRGEPWEFRFYTDYQRTVGATEELRSVSLQILPHVGDHEPIPHLVVGTGWDLTPAFLAWYIKKYLPATRQVRALAS